MQRFWYYKTVPVHTASAFVLLCGGILLVRPDREPMAILLADSLGGQMARRLPPALIVSFFLLGLIRLAAGRAGLFGLAFGVSLLITASMVVTVNLVLWVSKTIGRSNLNDGRPSNGSAPVSSDSVSLPMPCPRSSGRPGRTAMSIITTSMV